MLATLFAYLLFSGSASAASYNQNCWILDGEDFVRGSLRIEGTAWARERTGFEEAGCVKPWIIYRETFKELARNGEALDLEMQRASYEPLTREVAEALNLGGLCGIRNWKAHTETVVTGLDCGDFPVPRAGEAVFTRLKIGEGQSFSLGMEAAGFDGTAPERRYRALEPEPFRPQK